ncbi:MAG: transglutaminase domain-containing protein [Dehalococcoidia bacterium]|nr:transglutaminase domain-containing protein [Dehalococcoidia bacterium]
MTTTKVTLSQPTDVDLSPPDWLGQLSNLARRFSPSEGWDTFLLMYLAVGISAWVVREADFVSTPGLMGVIFVACLVGMLMAKVRGLIWPIPYVAGLLIGLIVATYQTATLLEDQIAITGLFTVWDRVREWYDVAVTGGISRDLLPSTLYLLLLAWLLGYISSWFLFKWTNPWIGLMLSGVALLTTLSFLPDQFDSRFFIFVFIAMLLVARVSIVQRDALWSKLDIGAITKIRDRVLSAPVILVVTAIILIAAIGAPLRVYVVRTAIDVWNWGRDPLTVFEDDFARLFSGITSKNDVNGRFFGNTLPFIGKISFGGDVVMVANSQTPTYWLSRSYSHYTSKGWIAGKTIKFNVGPEGLPPPPHESDNRELAFQRVQLTFDSDELFVGGNVDWVSHDAVVETLEPRVFHIDLKTPALDAELPADIQELAAELRNLLNPPPNRFIESLIAEVMPDDLIILDVIPGSESEQWRDQKAVTLRRKDPEIPEVVNWEFKQTQPQDEPYTLYSFVSQASNNQLQEAGDEYPSFITDHYLQLPITLPDRVRDLAERITEGAATPLDKALAVQSYLRSEGGFEYSQDIESPPPNADGVDWFLFETKTGYSDYFGSSMTVMLRSVGVPARMAAGYAPGELDITGRWAVRDRDSHGWTQVYFPGHGWIDFEPTTAWDPIDRGELTVDITDTGEEDAEDPLADFLDNITSEGSMSLEEECELLEQADPEEAEALGCDDLLEPLPSGPGAVQAGWQPNALAVPAGITLIALASIWLLVWLVWNIGLGRAGIAERYYIKMARLGTLAGVRRQPYHTPIDYAVAIGDAVPAASSGAQAVAWTFAIGRYAHIEESEEDIESLRDHWKKIRGGLISRTLKRILPVGRYRV